MNAGFFLSDVSHAQERTYHRVVPRELLETVLPQPIGPAVSHVRYPDPVLGSEEQCDRGGSHARQLRVPDCGLEDSGVGPIEGLAQQPLGIAFSSLEDLSHRGDGDSAGFFTAQVPAHAVGHDQQVHAARGIGELRAGVLVAGSDAAGIGQLSSEQARQVEIGHR